MTLSLATLCCAAAVFAAPSEVVLGPAESRKDLAELAASLAGRYDNSPQLEYLTGMKRGASAPPRLHLSVQPVAGSSTAFTVEEHDGSDHDPVVRRGTLTLAADPTTRQPRMTLSDAPAGCEWRWSRRNGVWMGRPMGACRDLSAATPGLAGKTLWLGDEEFWLEAPGIAVMTELGRARAHECYIAVKQRGGKPQIFTGLRLHDRGGSLQIVTADPQPRTLTLSLTRGMWPSNSGNNLVELLILYLREAGPAGSDPPSLLGSGWATPESLRVGFGMEEEGVAEAKTANARCKRISP
ncbi:MAG: hypothetical protein ACKOEL_08040 [Planctomycetota bacterium]